MLPALLPIFASIGSKIASSLFPDPAQETDRQRVQNEVTIAVMQQAGAIEKAAASIVNTEAASSHWLAANWRPLTMLTFVALIVARWFGFSAPGMSEAEILSLWSIVQLGLGGYVIGRSAEKIVPAIAAAIKK